MTRDARASAGRCLRARIARALSHPPAFDAVSLIDGAEYIGAGANNQTLNAILPDGDGTFTRVAQVVLTGRTGTIILRTWLKVTVANGQVRVFFGGVTEVRCR